MGAKGSVGHVDDAGIASKSAERVLLKMIAFHRGCLRSSWPHDFGKEDAGDASMNTEPDVPCFTARDRSSWPKV